MTCYVPQTNVTSFHEVLVVRDPTMPTHALLIWIMEATVSSLMLPLNVLIALASA